MTEVTMAVWISAEDYRRLEDGGDHSSSDRLRDIVAEVLKGAHLPDPVPFASVAVFAGEIAPANKVRGYGDVIGFLDVDRVLGDVALVATEDIQDAAYNGHPERIVVLSGSPEERRTTLRRVALAVRSNLDYAEARVARPLVRSDFLHFDVKGNWVLNLELQSKK